MADTNDPSTRTDPSEGGKNDGPSSNETCGQFPADEVLATYEDAPVARAPEPTSSPKS